MTPPLFSHRTASVQFSFSPTAHVPAFWPLVRGAAVVPVHSDNSQREFTVDTGAVCFKGELITEMLRLTTLLCVLCVAITTVHNVQVSPVQLYNKQLSITLDKTRPNIDFPRDGSAIPNILRNTPEYAVISLVLFRGTGGCFSHVAVFGVCSERGWNVPGKHNDRCVIRGWATESSRAPGGAAGVTLETWTLLPRNRTD